MDDVTPTPKVLLLLRLLPLMALMFDFDKTLDNADDAFEDDIPRIMIVTTTRIEFVMTVMMVLAVGGAMTP
jgi:hypothetical protein